MWVCTRVSGVPCMPCVLHTCASCMPRRLLCQDRGSPCPEHIRGRAHAGHTRARLVCSPQKSPVCARVQTRARAWGTHKHTWKRCVRSAPTDPCPCWCTCVLAHPCAHKHDLSLVPPYMCPVSPPTCTHTKYTCAPRHPPFECARVCEQDVWQSCPPEVGHVLLPVGAPCPWPLRHGHLWGGLGPGAGQVCVVWGPSWGQPCSLPPGGARSVHPALGRLPSCPWVRGRGLSGPYAARGQGRESDPFLSLGSGPHRALPRPVLCV